MYCPYCNSVREARKLFKKKGKAHIVLSFVCPTNELRDYDINPSNRNLLKDCKRAKSDEERKLWTVTKLSTDEESYSIKMLLKI